MRIMLIGHDFGTPFEVPVLPRVGDRVVVGDIVYVAGPCEFDGGSLIRLHVTPLSLRDTVGDIEPEVLASTPVGGGPKKATGTRAPSKKRSPTP